MNVTLKRAADLARAALDAAAKMKIETRIVVSIHDGSPLETVETARTRMLRQVDDVEALIRAGFTIRGQIGAANAQAGVDNLLTERAMLEAVQKRLTGLGSEDETAYEAPSVTGDLVQRLAFAKRRAESGSAYGHSEHLAVGLVDADVGEGLAERRGAIRRSLSDIKDRVAGINLNTTISLDETTVAVLKKAKIV